MEVVNFIGNFKARKTSTHNAKILFGFPWQSCFLNLVKKYVATGITKNNCEKLIKKLIILNQTSRFQIIKALFYHFNLTTEFNSLDTVIK